MPPTGQKRKVDYNAPGTPAQARKRQKGRDARAIPTQTADAALSTTGELNISSFVKAREFEIAALQQSMRKSRKSLTQRAFQQVPRHMRRRTASHNVKKIPRRLRTRALREVKEDNTPTGSARKKKLSSKLRLRLETAKRLQRLNAQRKSVRQRKKQAKLNAKEGDPAKHVEIQRVPRIKKNKLVTPPQATSKFKRRQVSKTWLPTHLWHTKRAHLTRPTLPLWRMAIPLRPTEKSYRPTHRATGMRGCVAWDTSYVSTIGCQGTRQALESMLKALGFPGERWNGIKYRKWSVGARHSGDWIFSRDSKRPVAPVTILWQAKSDSTTSNHTRECMDQDEGDKVAAESSVPKHVKLDRRLFLRIHPSAFHQLWMELLKVAKMQKPQVLIEDLRFEIGSVTVQGPQATEALVGVLKLAPEQSYSESLWPMLSSLNNPATLPLNAVLTFETLDPRLEHPPRQKSVLRDEQTMNKLNETIVSWPLDNVMPSSSLFDHGTRYRVTKSLPSQKSINRRRSALLPGQQIEITEKDPRIPTILLAHRAPRSDSNAQGHWSVLLPWGCVDLVWRSLMYYPLSTGSTPRFGGLEQTQQVAFENSVPWFPGDYPGLDAGKAWDRTESENRFDRWVRRPPSKRHAWDAVDLGLGRKGELGRGWACDWEFLFRDAVSTGQASTKDKTSKKNEETSSSTQPRLLTQRQRKAAKATVEKEMQEQNRRRNSSSPELDDHPWGIHNDIDFDQLTPSQAASFLANYGQSLSFSKPMLATIRVKLLTRGTPAAAARIYRLPRSRTPRSTSDTSGETEKVSGPLKVPTVEKLPSDTNPSLFIDADPHQHSNPSLRQRWLNLDPNPLSHPENPNSSTSLPSKLGAAKATRHGDPISHTVYDTRHTRDLSHIRVFPPRETKPEVLNMFGPAPPPRTEKEVLQVLQPQPVPKMVVGPDGDLVIEELWDKHVPCPGPEDLIGYATSGGYNLVEGRGTAVGAILVQRITEGWKAEDDMHAGIGDKATDGDGDPTSQQIPDSAPKTTQNKRSALAAATTTRITPAKQTKEEIQQAKIEKLHAKRIDRERHLCIVRNAGESVGRLAIWELC